MQHWTRSLDPHPDLPLLYHLWSAILPKGSGVLSCDKIPHVSVVIAPEIVDHVYL